MAVLRDFPNNTALFVGPEPIATNGIMGPLEWPYKWVSGVTIPLSGVITLLITGTGRGPDVQLPGEEGFLGSKKS